MKKILKRIFASMLTLCVLCTINATALDSDHVITEDELWAAVEQGLADVTYEKIDLTTLSADELSKDVNLQILLDKINDSVPYPTNHATATRPTAYRTTINYAGDEACYTSIPTIYFTVVDVGTSSSASIATEFKVNEAITVNNKPNNLWNNAIRYRNVRATMGCGVNSEFTNAVSVSGQANDLNPVDIKALFQLVTSLSDYTTLKAISSALSVINFPSSSPYTITKNVTGSTPTRAVGAKFNNKNVLFDTGDFFRMDSSLSTSNSKLQRNVLTCAMTKWTYDVYFGLGATAPTYSNDTLSSNLNYRVNV